MGLSGGARDAFLEDRVPAAGRWIRVAEEREEGLVEGREPLPGFPVGRRVEDLNAWILTEAFSALASCRIADDLPFVMAVNVSPAELDSRAVVANLAEALALGRVPAHRVVVELSERLVAEDQAT